MVSLSPPMNIVVHYCPDTNQERNIKEGNTKEINTNALKKTKWAGECLWNLSSAKLAKFITKIITNIYEFHRNFYIPIRFNSFINISNPDVQKPGLAHRFNETPGRASGSDPRRPFYSYQI